MKKLIKKILLSYFGKYDDAKVNVLSKLLAEQKLQFVDVGASGGLEPRWSAVRNVLRCFLFEPDERSLKDLDVYGDDRVFAVAVGNHVGEGAFNLCQKAQVSSTYLPNIDFVRRFPDASRYDVVGREKCAFSTLDLVLKDHLQDIDFLKLDVQGGELDVLEGASALLSGPVIGLEVEVEILPLYKDQPLFGDIVRHLSKNGFEFLDFTNLCRWERDQFSLFGQNVFGDGLFMRPPEIFAQQLALLPHELAVKKARSYIAICAIYDRLDLLEVCRREFSPFMDEKGQGLTADLQAMLQDRRKKINLIMQFANRILSYMGFRLMPIQWR